MTSDDKRKEIHERFSAARKSRTALLRSLVKEGYLSLDEYLTKYEVIPAKYADRVRTEYAKEIFGKNYKSRMNIAITRTPRDSKTGRFVSKRVGKQELVA